MARFDIHDMKKQASFFFREKVKNARLALTDVSHIQLLAEDATNADPWGPETRTMAMLSEAAFELEEYERIVQVLHSRLDPNGKRPWRQLFKTLTVLEYLLTHGPGSLSNEFRSDTFCIEELCQFNFIDQQGIDRGIGIRNKADRVLELLSKADLWKEARSRAQKISHGINGFGSSIERANVATENEENHDTKSDVSGPKDAESESLLADWISQEVQPNLGPPVEWKPFEKCISIPSYLQREDGSSASSDEGTSRSVEHDQRKSPAYKKCLSSPAHFRNIWQAFPNVTDNESTFASHTSEETGEPILLEASKDADKEASPSCEVLQMKFPDAPQLEKVGPPPHLSMRRLFDFHQPLVDFPQNNVNQHGSHEIEHAKDKDAKVHEEKVVAEAFQTPRQVGLSSTKPGKTSDLPLLPPPPPSKFRTRIKQHFKPSNLIDL